MSLSKSDFNDADLVDSLELLSDGYSVYKTIPIVGTTSGTKNIQISPTSSIFGLIFDADAPASPGDRVRLVGTSGADGYYTIGSIVDNDNFIVLENISSSTGGNASFIYPPGAKSVGFDPSGLSITTAKNVQDAIRDVANNASGISSSQHEILDTLIHNIAEDGYSVITYSGNNIINYTIWTDSSMVTKIRDYTINYTISPCNQKIDQVVTKQYNNLGLVVQTLTENFVYSGNKIINITSTKI
jgi:hypothetical protein